MLSQHDSRRAVCMKSLAEDIIRNPQLAVALLDTLSAQLKDPDIMRQFTLPLSAKVKPETLTLLQVLGESAKMVDKR